MIALWVYAIIGAAVVFISGIWLIRDTVWCLRNEYITGSDFAWELIFDIVVALLSGVLWPLTLALWVMFKIGR